MESAGGVPEDQALRLILEGTSDRTGAEFFRALVRSLSEALGTHGAWVTEIDREARRLKAYAFWIDGRWVDDYSYAIDGTPCEGVVDRCRPVHVPENVVDLFPRDEDLRLHKAVSYFGVPLTDVDGRVLGNLAVLDRRPMPEDPRTMAVVGIFAARASAELRRLQAEAELQRREEQVRGVVDSALDAIVQLDVEWKVVRVNPAAEKTFGARSEGMVGRFFGDFLQDDSLAALRRLGAELERREAGPRSSWVPGGLQARRVDGAPFPAEASMALFETGRTRYRTIILRDVNERLEAERRITLLREEIRALEGPGEIVGASPAFRRVLDDVRQVADTDAAVLLLGETGTGKERIARLIHALSRRKDQPLVRLNCGAVPAALLESELFGHEKGAFTGAVARREGRFSQADGGTLFLDEIGEIPLEQQVKLLRVLQEGEFEPVGSGKTSKVDVRILAATNRDLAAEAKAGRFREDLYYRLNVFPIRLPPLRERKEDIAVLVEAFVRQIGHRLGRRVQPLDAREVARLAAYEWPGNVRELQNVVERALILSTAGRLALDRALPETVTKGATPEPAGRVLNAVEMEDLERANLRNALEQAGGRVGGPGGAAELLGMKPTTLSSRLKALGIR